MRRAEGIAAAAALALLAAAPGAAAPATQSLTVTAGLAAVADDNILRYSDRQRRELVAGQHPHRFGVARPGDLVIRPALALQWQAERGEGRRALRLASEGGLHRRSGIADFGVVSLLWRESRPAGRLSVMLEHAPDHYLRRLYDRDLADRPSDQRYRDARADRLAAQVAVRRPAPGASWLDLAWRGERRRHDAAFRERDSHTHRATLAAGWERLPRAGRLHAQVGLARRDARAEDGRADPATLAEVPDVGYRALGAEVGGDLRLAQRGAASLGLDLRLEIERRVFESRRPADAGHFGRRDLAHEAEAGLRARFPGRLAVRAFYRRLENRARFGAAAPPGAEIGGHRVHQAGLELEWTREVWRR